MPREVYKTDKLTSERMSAVRPLDTGPERLVRKILSSLGYRYRLNRYDLPGRPDIVLPAHRKAIFIHGCFWHRHPRCPKASVPSRNEALWRGKFNKTVQRDRQNTQALEQAGWQVLVIWECEIKEHLALERRLRDFLE